MPSKLQLGDIAEIVMGQSPSGETCNQDGRGLPLLNGPTEFGLRHPYPVQFTLDPKKVAAPGDLLFCVRGSTTGRMNWADQTYAIGRGIAAIRGKNGYPTVFVRAAIEVQLQALLAAATGSTFPNVGKDLLSALPVPDCDRHTAHLISEVIEPLDSQIWNLAETNTTLESIAQTIFKSWFIDFDPVRAKAEGREPEGMDAETAALFPSEFQESELGPIPKGWRIGAFRDLANLSKHTVNPQTHPDREFEHYSLPAFDAGQLPIVEFGESIRSNKTIVPPHAILMSKLNPHIPRVWLTGNVSDLAVCSTEFLPWVPVQGSSHEYIYCLLTAEPFQKALQSLVTGTSNSHQRVAAEQVSGLPCILPPPQIHHTFYRAVLPILKRVILSRHQVQTLANIRDALLPRLISGKLRIPEAQGVVEEVLT